MSKTLCGVDCTKCGLKDTCGGCIETNGRPFGKECMVARCCLTNGHESCGKCGDSGCKLKQQVVAEFNALGIKDMPKVKDMNQIKGAYINLAYTLPNGETVKMWEDDKIYLANQICKIGSDRCFGLTADEDYLLVCEYGEGGTDAEIIVYKKRIG